MFEVLDYGVDFVEQALNVSMLGWLGHVLRIPTEQLSRYTM